MLAGVGVVGGGGVVVGEEREDGSSGVSRFWAASTCCSRSMTRVAKSSGGKVWVAINCVGAV